MVLHSSVLGGAAALGGAALSASATARASRRNIRFQREMATTAHQKEVKDLRLAGLNPILSGTGGPGARASGGAQQVVPDFAASARQAMRIAAEVKLLSQQARGAQFKADIDGPAAMVGRAATEAATKIAEGAKTRKYSWGFNKDAVAFEDNRPMHTREGYRGPGGSFTRKRTSKKERLRAKARRSRSRNR